MNIGWAKEVRTLFTDNECIQIETERTTKQWTIIWSVFYAAITQYSLCINKCHFTQPDIRDNDNVTYHYQWIQDKLSQQ